MTYVVGFSPRKGDYSAIALVCQLARSDRDDVHAVTVVPQSWGTPVVGDTDREFKLWAEEQGAASVEEALALLAEHPDIPSTASFAAGRSVPQALLGRAEELGATLIVVGSGDDGPSGMVQVTSKTNRLLHSSRIPVAIAPRGYRSPPGAKVDRVTVGFRGDDATWTLLDQVSAIARRVGASLRLVTFAVRKSTMYPPRGVSDAEDMVHVQWQEQARRELTEAVAHLRQSGFADDQVESQLAAARSWGGAMDALEWGRNDVLVVGSSSSHPLAQVFLGSSAAKILRNSPVPVIVVP